VRSILIRVAKVVQVEIARVLPGAHRSSCESHWREGEWEQVDEQLSTAEVGRGSSLDL
jgi:hypothetical protein